MLKILLLAITIFLCRATYAKSTVESIGDYTQILVPAYAFGMAMNEDGYSGVKDFITQFATMELIVNGLKLTIHERRPDASNHMSFPSGHSASAFSGAAFIHKRYGYKRAIIPYIMAAYTGFSRVYANRHHIHDVFAGALIGGLTGWFMTSRLSDGTETNLEIFPDGAKFNFRISF